MKIHVLLAFAGLASGISLPAIAQDKNKVDPKIEQQIRALAANYDAAINKHDPAAVAALYARDAVRATALNDGTFYGRPAIEKAYAKYDFGRWQVSNYFTRIYRLPRSAMRCVRPVCGALFTLERATASTRPTAMDAGHGLSSVKAILGRSAGIPPAAVRPLAI
jgi:Domain of unknown function (DUF4440)